ncbi:MAG: family 16 glycosylhydrolase [Cytophagaceae bacterium]|nr:family 16 glycosylhydrolase [Cytophagaceae bacterium]
MKKLHQKFSLTFALIIISIIFNTNIQAQCWTEVWSDEFNGASLDLTKWNYDLGTGCPGLCGWGNNEKETYTNSTQNVNVTGGNLNITARYSAGAGGTGYDFTSGKIHTRNKFDWLYGRFEARMKLPAGTGMWPAFWMLPDPTSNPYGGWPTSGEMDIMEFRGDLLSTMNGTVHYGNPAPNNRYDGTTYTLATGDFVNSFHTFAMEWGPGEIRWYVDDILFKTETQTPNSLNPASNNAVTWPWDQNFYMIFNLAVGGWYSGNPSTATIIGGDVNYNRTMQVDYVRVYNDLSGSGFTGSIAGKSSILQNESGVTYSIPTGTGATYAWTVTGGAIASGQGNNSITVNWGSTDGTVSVLKTLACGSVTYNLPVTVQPTHCGMVYEDFENIRHQSYGFMNGIFVQNMANPSSSAQNTSPYVSRYTRNAADQYDVLIIENISLGDADDFEKKIKRFLMDVYSNAAGRVIEIVLEDPALSSPTNYPVGRHSTYRATTGAANSWETLEFAYINSPDAAVVGANATRLTILFSPNTYTNTVFYFDNLMATHKPVTSNITGSASTCENQAGRIYSVTNTAGSSYAWAVPSGSVITAGSTGPNNNSVTLTTGTVSGNVSVIETNTTGCAGTAVNFAVTVNARPNTSSITGSATACTNQSGLIYSVTATAGSSYAWTVPAGASITAGSTGPNNNSVTVNIGTVSGNIGVTETNAAGCTGTNKTLSVTVSTCTGISYASNGSFNIYPVPAEANLRVEFKESFKGITQITITDNLGRVMEEFQAEGASDVELNISSLPSGIYFVQIKNNELTEIRKFIKK